MVMLVFVAVVIDSDPEEAVIKLISSLSPAAKAESESHLTIYETIALLFDRLSLYENRGGFGRSLMNEINCLSSSNQNIFLSSSDR